MRTRLWRMLWYLHLTLGMADVLGIRNPKQNNEATVWGPGSEDLVKRAVAPACALPCPRDAQAIEPPHASARHTWLLGRVPLTLLPSHKAF